MTRRPAPPVLPLPAGVVAGLMAGVVAGVVMVSTALTAPAFTASRDQAAVGPAFAVPPTPSRPTVRPTVPPALAEPLRREVADLPAAHRVEVVRRSLVDRGVPAHVIRTGVVVDPRRGLSADGGPRVDVLVG